MAEPLPWNFQERALIFITARRVRELRKTKQLIEKGKGKAEIITADLSKISSINKLIQQIKTKTKKLDTIVNVAGIWHDDKEAYYGTSFEDHDIQRIQEIFDVGIIGTTIFTQQLIPLINSGGKIINITGDSSEEEKGWLH